MISPLWNFPYTNIGSCLANTVCSLIFSIDGASYQNQLLSRCIKRTFWRDALQSIDVRRFPPFSLLFHTLFKNFHYLSAIAHVLLKTITFKDLGHVWDVAKPFIGEPLWNIASLISQAQHRIIYRSFVMFPQSISLYAFLALFVTCPTLSGATKDSKRLHEDILSDYNRLIRPVQNNTEVLTVQIGLKLSQLIEVVSVYFYLFILLFKLGLIFIYFLEMNKS